MLDVKMYVPENWYNKAKVSIHILMFGLIFQGVE